MPLASLKVGDIFCYRDTTILGSSNADWKANTPIRVMSIYGHEVKYEYIRHGKQGGWSKGLIMAHGDPWEPAKCNPGCNPAAPCLVGDTCGGKRPECTAADGFREWAQKQDCLGVAGRDMFFPPGGTAPPSPGGTVYLAGDGACWVLRRHHLHPEPMRSGSGALACDWIQRSRRG